jgi:hypothetical protein
VQFVLQEIIAMVEILQKLLVPQVTSARLEQNGQLNSHVWQVPREQQLEVPQPLVVLLALLVNIVHKARRLHSLAPHNLLVPTHPQFRIQHKISVQMEHIQ